jgi:hypothetical protein
MIDAQRTLFIFISLPADVVAGRAEQTAKLHGKQSAKSQRKQPVTTGGGESEASASPKDSSL